MKFWMLLLLIFLSLNGHLVNADIFNVDMENTGVCTTSGPVIVRPQDVYNIYAEPLQDHKGIRDKCTVRFQGLEGRKFKIFVRDLIFRECQIFIKVFEGPVEAVSLNNPRYKFGCNSGTGSAFPTYSDEIAISLQKPDSTTTGYKFYIKLATEDGPDIGDGRGPQAVATGGMSGGVIAGIAVACVLILVVIIAVAIYLIIAFRRKHEEKEAIARSTSILFPSGTVHDGSAHGSVHSSAHNSVASVKHSLYPAFRTTISEKHAKCNSIDTGSVDTDQVDNRVETNPKNPKPVKNVSHEFDSMRRGLARESYKKAREEEDLQRQEARWHEHQRADRQSRLESQRGFGRPSRTQKDDLRLTDANIRQSLREARNRGRSFDDLNSHRGSTRSGRSKQRSHHSPARSVPTYHGGRADSDYNYSDVHSDTNHRDRSRTRTRSQSGRTQRASSTGSNSRRKREHDYYDERDSSDYDDRRRRDRHNSRERFIEDRDERRGDPRSSSQRTRSYSTGSRRR